MIAGEFFVRVLWTLGGLAMTLVATVALAAGPPGDGGDRQRPPAVRRPPNIIYVMTDDQGYGDIAAHGNPVLKTPNLDWLHAQSVRLTEFHASPTCAPTRAALLTGRHEFRSGVTHTIFERERLALSATTLPQLLAAAGYTSGIFGKGLRSHVHPRRRRDRPVLSGQLRRRAGQPLHRPDDSQRRHVREDQGLLHRPVLRRGDRLDGGMS
jgi:arylsulfatase A-like enzyme